MICQLSITAEFNGDVIIVNSNKKTSSVTVCATGNYNAERICLSGDYLVQNTQAVPTKRPMINTNYTEYILSQNPIFTDY